MKVDNKIMFNTYSVREFALHSKPISDLKWNCDGNLLGAAGSDKFVKIHILDSAGSLKLLQSIPCFYTPNALYWHPFNSSRFAVISDEKSIEIWDVRSGSQNATMKINGTGGHIHASWSPCGKYLGVGNQNDLFIILEVATGKLLKKHKFVNGKL